MFFNEELKPLRQELKSAGADMSEVRNWIKIYEKVKSNYPKVKKTYDVEREKLESLQAVLNAMETCFITGENVKDSLRRLGVQIKEIKDFVGHEFLIDKGNSEFELTFSRMKKMLADLDKIADKDMLFLHSETENLSDMIKEALEKEMPDFHALAYFSATQNVSKIEELPHGEKVKKIKRIYEREFVKPMECILSAAMENANISMPILSANKDKSKEERIDYIMEEWIWN